MVVRGIRGATTAAANEEQAILGATRELLEAIVNQNAIEPQAIASVFVTVTHDLNAAFPAKAIRRMAGWELVPLMCSLEIDVPDGLSQCIRLMVLVNTDKAQDEIVHVYLNDAVKLRPDLSST